ncbi:MAG: hypothetical protein JSS57_16380 [Proteobacteria bacterium]|nr:hypothetical protein [Pseudomonadota bacterium]
MRVIVPVTPVLTSSTVAEPDAGESVYSAATTYALGARVISLASHRLYESLQASNVGQALPVPPETQTDWWIEVGVTNRYACVDLARNTQSVGASPMVITITPGQRINALAVMGMEADGVQIQMHNGADVVYDKTFDLRLRRVRNGFEYAFKPFDLQPSVVQFDLPPFSNSVITLTLTRSTGVVRIGSIVVGTYAYLGATEFGAVNDALNFSTIDRDIYGTATLIPRRTLPKTNQTVLADKNIVSDLLDIRTRLNAVPAVWSGLDDVGSDGYFEALLILGVYKQFSINLARPVKAEVQLELEEI